MSRFTEDKYVSPKRLDEFWNGAGAAQDQLKDYVDEQIGGLDPGQSLNKYELKSNKSNTIVSSTEKYPTTKAVQDYVIQMINGITPGGSGVSNMKQVTINGDDVDDCLYFNLNGTNSLGLIVNISTEAGRNYVSSLIIGLKKSANTWLVNSYYYGDDLSYTLGNGSIGVYRLYDEGVDIGQYMQMKVNPAANKTTFNVYVLTEGFDLNKIFATDSEGIITDYARDLMVNINPTKISGSGSSPSGEIAWDDIVGAPEIPYVSAESIYQGEGIDVGRVTVTVGATTTTTTFKAPFGGGGGSTGIVDWSNVINKPLFSNNIQNDRYNYNMFASPGAVANYVDSESFSKKFVVSGEDEDCLCVDLTGVQKLSFSIDITAPTNNTNYVGSLLIGIRKTGVSSWTADSYYYGTNFADISAGVGIYGLYDQDTDVLIRQILVIKTNPWSFNTVFAIHSLNENFNLDSITNVDFGTFSDDYLVGQILNIEPTIISGGGSGGSVAWNDITGKPEFSNRIVEDASDYDMFVSPGAVVDYVESYAGNTITFVTNGQDDDCVIADITDLNEIAIKVDVSTIRDGQDYVGSVIIGAKKNEGTWSGHAYYYGDSFSDTLDGIGIYRNLSTGETKLIIKAKLSPTTFNIHPLNENIENIFNTDQIASYDSWTPTNIAPSTYMPSDGVQFPYRYDDPNATHIATISVNGTDYILKAPSSGGGVQQQQVDWNASSGVTSIANKPTIPSDFAVDIADAESGNILIYDGDEGKWITGDLPNVNEKADKVSGATTGDFAGLDSSGNLTDSGKSASDFISKVSGATANDIVKLNADGTISDSGVSINSIPSTLGSLTDVSTTGAANGKVLGYNNGSWGPVNQSGGGGSSVQSDWTEDDSFDPSYIENKPFIREYHLEKSGSTVQALAIDITGLSEFSFNAQMMGIANTTSTSNPAGTTCMLFGTADLNGNSNWGAGASKIRAKTYVAGMPVFYAKTTDSGTGTTDGRISKSSVRIVLDSSKYYLVIAPASSFLKTNVCLYWWGSSINGGVPDVQIVTGTYNSSNIYSFGTSKKDLIPNWIKGDEYKVNATEQVINGETYTDAITGNPTPRAAECYASMGTIVYLNNRISALEQGGGGGGVTQLNSDWDITSASDVRCILHKPSIPSSFTVDTSTTAPSNGDVLTYSSTGSKWVPQAPSGGGGSSVQSNWNETDSSNLAYIQNKPTIPSSFTVNPTNVQNGNALVYNNGSWVPGSMPDVSGKANKVTGGNTSGKLASLDSNGDLTNSGILATNVLQKVSGATNGDFASLDSNGVVADSGYKASDFATSTQGTKADNAIPKVTGATQNHFASFNSDGTVKDSGKSSSDFMAYNGVSVFRRQTTGTNIADITINGNTTQLYAPTSGGGTTVVRANWNETDPSADGYILNKPTLATVATSGSLLDLVDVQESSSLADGDILAFDSNTGKWISTTMSAVTGALPIKSTINRISDPVSETYYDALIVELPNTTNMSLKVDVGVQADNEYSGSLLVNLKATRGNPTTSNNITTADAYYYGDAYANVLDEICIFKVNGFNVLYLALLVTKDSTAQQYLDVYPTTFSIYPLNEHFDQNLIYKDNWVDNISMNIDSNFGDDGKITITPTMISGGGGLQTQADWDENNSSAPSFIRNKPTIPTTLSDLSDVSSTTPTNGQVLTYDDVNDKWAPQDPEIESNIYVIDNNTGEDTDIPNALTIDLTSLSLLYCKLDISNDNGQSGSILINAEKGTSWIPFNINSTYSGDQYDSVFGGMYLHTTEDSETHIQQSAKLVLPVLKSGWRVVRTEFEICPVFSFNVNNVTQIEYISSTVGMDQIIPSGVVSAESLGTYSMSEMDTSTDCLLMDLTNLPNVSLKIDVTDSNNNSGTLYLNSEKTSGAFTSQSTYSYYTGDISSITSIDFYNLTGTDPETGDPLDPQNYLVLKCDVSGFNVVTVSVYHFNDDLTSEQVSDSDFYSWSTFMEEMGYTVSPVNITPFEGSRDYVIDTAALDYDNKDSLCISLPQLSNISLKIDINYTDSDNESYSGSLILGGSGSRIWDNSNTYVYYEGDDISSILDEIKFYNFSMDFDDPAEIVSSFLVLKSKIEPEIEPEIESEIESGRITYTITPLNSGFQYSSIYTSNYEDWYSGQADDEESSAVTFDGPTAVKETVNPTNVLVADITDVKESTLKFNVSSVINGNTNPGELLLGLKGERTDTYEYTSYDLKKTGQSNPYEDSLMIDLSGLSEISLKINLTSTYANNNIYSGTLWMKLRLDVNDKWTKEKCYYSGDNISYLLTENGINFYDVKYSNSNVVTYLMVETIYADVPENVNEVKIDVCVLNENFDPIAMSIVNIGDITMNWDDTADSYTQTPINPTEISYDPWREEEFVVSSYYYGTNQSQIIPSIDIYKNSENKYLLTLTAIDTVNEGESVNITLTNINGDKIRYVEVSTNMDEEPWDNVLHITPDIIEKQSNKVIVVNDESTNTTYPSAKAVYDAINDIVPGIVPDIVTDIVPDIVPDSQATTTIVKDAVTNINGYPAAANTNYSADLMTVGGYEVYEIKYKHETVDDNSNYDPEDPSSEPTITTTTWEALTESEAVRYMQYMTGSTFLPRYNFERPQNSLFVFPDGSMWKPQFVDPDPEILDDTTHMYLYKIPATIVIECEVDANDSNVLVPKSTSPYYSEISLITSCYLNGKTVMVKYETDPSDPNTSFVWETIIGFDGESSVFYTRNYTLNMSH